MTTESKPLALSETAEYLTTWLENIVDSIEYHNLDQNLVQTEIEAVSYLLDVVEKVDTKGEVEMELVLDLQSRELATENGTSKEAVIKAAEIYEEIAGIWFYDRDAYSQLIKDTEKVLR